MNYWKSLSKIYHLTSELLPRYLSECSTPQLLQHVIQYKCYTKSLIYCMSYKSAKDVIIVSLSGLPVMMNKAVC